DRGYDHEKYRREVWRRGIKPVIACRGTARVGVGDLPLGRRAYFRLASPVPSTAHPLRPRPRDARGLHAPRLRDRLLAPARRRLIVKQALSRRGKENTDVSGSRRALVITAAALCAVLAGSGPAWAGHGKSTWERT